MPDIDDERFERGLVGGSIRWAWSTFALWHMPGALEKDREWGLVTVRQRVLFRLDLVLAMLARTRWYPAIAEATQRTLDALSARWTDVFDTPVYPAFRPRTLLRREPHEPRFLDSIAAILVARPAQCASRADAMISGISRAGLTVSRIALAAVGAVFMALSALVGSAEESVTSKPRFSDGEIKIILSHGPWPAPVAHDATNRVSGKPDAIEFGTLLFFDRRLSGSGTKACGSCHVPERNWTDNLRRGVGTTELDRNTPTLMNVRGQRWYGWDGAADSLWFQSLRPIVDARELAATPRHVANLLRNDEQLSCRYRKVFGAPPSPTDDEAVFVNVGKVLAAFQETLVSGRTPFDEFREALARGESPSSLSYSTPAQRGLQIFIGKGGCTSCHSGPNFTNGEFFKSSLSQSVRHGKRDPGRYAVARPLRESRFSLLGPYSDDPTGASAAHTRALAIGNGSYGEFKVPSLRNLMLTAPYGHNGDVETIAEVVRLHANDGQPAGAADLTVREQTDLIVFLESLTTFANPWRPEDAGRCQ